MITYIYYLEKEGLPHYIGKTINPVNRKQQHRKKYPLSIFNIIDEVSVIGWQFWEKYWISQFKSWGFKLDNINNGGGLTKHTEDSKKKISEANIGNKKALGNKNMLGKHHSDESKKKMSQANIGNKNATGERNEETKRKISESLKGREVSEETRKKLSELMIGNKRASKIRNDDIKKKISEGVKLYWKNKKLKELDVNI